MRRNNKLFHSVTTMALTAILLLAITVAWFVNKADPATDLVNFASGKLDIAVTVDQMVVKNGTVTFEALPVVDGSVILKASNMVPSEKKTYRVTVTNNGASCKVFFGLSDVLDLITKDDKKLSNKINFAVYAIDENNQEISGSRMDGGLIGNQLQGGRTGFFLNDGVLLAAGDSMSRIYELKFDESGDNYYQELAMQAAVAVSAILSQE